MFVRDGFRWDSADAYMFDIDGTLLNSRDAVHYFAFLTALREVLSMEATMDDVPVHGNTDPGILRAVLSRHGMSDGEIDAHLPRMVERMCAEVTTNSAALRPEVCPSILQLLTHLRGRGKLLGVASGNLAAIGWLKLEKAGLRSLMSFASFSYPRELRSEIFREGVNEARKALGAEVKVCVVGDTPSDVAAAISLGLPVIALATGVYEFQQLLACAPDACFACGTDLMEFGQKL
ncbi:MAG: HAD family hydrolase [Candidatus Angelobacter sp.]